jgi:hypothetical protein
LVLENTDRTVTRCCQHPHIQEKKAMSMHNFHTQINTNPGAILTLISTKKPSNMFVQKKNKAYRRLATQEHISHCQNTKQCSHLLLHGDLHTTSTVPLCHVGAWSPSIMARSATCPSCCCVST